MRWAHRNVHYFDESLKSLEEAREYGEPLATDEGARAFVRYLSETLSPTVLAKLVRVLEKRKIGGLAFPVPLLLVHAKADPMLPPRVGRRLHELVPAAEMAWLDASSHFAYVNSPDRVAPLLLEFLLRPSTTAGEPMQSPVRSSA